MITNLPFTLNDLLQFFGIIVAFLVGGWALTTFFQFYARRWAAKSKTKLDDILVAKIKPPFSYIIWLLGIKVALRPLNL